MRNGVYYCYLIGLFLQGDTKCLGTYIGMTTCLARRVKQHNGAAKGGARATRLLRQRIAYELDILDVSLLHFRLIASVGLFLTQSRALRFEYYWKHMPSTKTQRYRSTRGLKERYDRVHVLLGEKEWMEQHLSLTLY